MALVLASQPVKHPNYPNGDHYAVLDTDTGNVEYFTLEEIQKDIDEEGTQFIGNHHLAIKDTKEKISSKGKNIVRDSNKAVLVYYKGIKSVIEFKSTHNLAMIRYQYFLTCDNFDCLEPTVYGVGILGVRSASTKYKDFYTIWSGLLFRAYHHGADCLEPSYKDCTIDNCWLFLPNFINWYVGQVNYNITTLKILKLEKSRFQVDKDILSKGNKFYSSDFCTLVPTAINKTLSYSYNKKSNLPICMYHSSNSYGYEVAINCNGNKITHDIAHNKANSNKDAKYFRSIAKQYIGIKDIPEDQWASIGYCFLWYKERKEDEIKRLAEYWYNYSYNGHTVHVITKECYDALMNWTVDIND